ncbi:predicted protein, partial [Arabidopsis lyrata subsp. lyrata]
MGEDIPFFDFNRVGVFFHFVAINVERNTLIQKRVQRFRIDTSVARNEIDANVYSRVFEILNGKIWMVYNKNLSDLKNLFNANFHACPIAKYEIDTTKWFAENFDGRIDNMSLEGVSDYFKLDVEKYEKQSSDKVERDCHLHIQMFPHGDWHCPNCTCKFCRAVVEECSQTLFEGVKKYVGVKHELEARFSWSLVHRECTDSDFILRWTPSYCGKQFQAGHSSLTVMDECFLPIIDRRSGGKYCTKCPLQFHGNRLAEMQFIGTRHVYRHQGMCRRLFSVVESTLQNLKVELLVIPATADLSHVWISKFGFKYVEDSLKKELRSMNLLAFPGIDVLQKELLAPRHAKSAADT